MPPKTIKKKCDIIKQPTCIECPCGSTYQDKGLGKENHFKTKKHKKYEDEKGKVTPQKNNNTIRKTVKKKNKQNEIFKPTFNPQKTIQDEVIEKIFKSSEDKPNTSVAVPIKIVTKKKKVHIKTGHMCPLLNDNRIFKNVNNFYIKSGTKYAISTATKERSAGKNDLHSYNYDDPYFIKLFWLLQKGNKYNNDFFTNSTIKKLEDFQKKEHPAINFLKYKLKNIKNKKYTDISGEKKEITDEFIESLNFTNDDWEPLLEECKNSVEENDNGEEILETKTKFQRVKGKATEDEDDDDDEDDDGDEDEDDDGDDDDGDDDVEIKDISNFLYPELDDDEFNTKLIEHVEFNPQTENTEESKKTLEEMQEDMKSSDFILSPHQIFVKNFLSQYTPYNGLFLFHGLGTGKTCSAIGISEEMRNYIKQTGNIKKKKIIIIASPNVQDNFKKQLFDESKLTKSKNGEWNIDGCLGNSMLNEINPTEIKNMKREDVITNINTIISSYYAFYGYTKFGNVIKEITEYKRTGTGDKLEMLKKRFKIRRIKEEFSDRLIIIDEAHNIRDITDADDAGDRDIYNQLKDIARYSENMKLLLLS